MLLLLGIDSMPRFALSLEQAGPMPPKSKGNILILSKFDFSLHFPGMVKPDAALSLVPGCFQKTV